VVRRSGHALGAVDMQKQSSRIPASRRVITALACPCFNAEGVACDVLRAWGIGTQRKRRACGAVRRVPVNDLGGVQVS
jgi:hypothetical protein